MCFTVSVNIVREEIEQRYGATLIDHDKYRPSFYYHAQALPQMPVLCSDKPGSIDLAVWGLVPYWIADEDAANDIRKKTFNARAETLSSKPAYSKAFESQRCLIPVTGFFEWQHINGKKIPWYISMADQKIFSIAGLWETWLSPGGITLKTFSLITVAANEMMAEIHNTKKRMPAILPREVEHIWIKQGLTPEDALMLLEPVTSEMLHAHTISPSIGNIKIDHNVPELIRPFTYPTQGTLF
jgi:putative SOS response-associated peptidase YedK